MTIRERLLGYRGTTVPLVPVIEREREIPKEEPLFQFDKLGKLMKKARATTTTNTVETTTTMKEITLLIKNEGACWCVQASAYSKDNLQIGQPLNMAMRVNSKDAALYAFKGLFATIQARADQTVTDIRISARDHMIDDPEKGMGLKSIAFEYFPALTEPGAFARFSRSDTLEDEQLAFVTDVAVGFHKLTSSDESPYIQKEQMNSLIVESKWDATFKGLRKWISTARAERLAPPVGAVTSDDLDF